MAWWKHAICYEIYVRSFQDSNGDGIGDLNGVAGRLEYLADLGIDTIWITPFYPSPQIDFGYDVSDYENVDPQFGTLADFDRLVSAAHARGIKVLIDMVLNHTSDQHPWFTASRASHGAPLRDWYIWRDGRGPGEPPNNWESVFGGPAWTFDERTGQWYYHCFYAEQPDLNWRNPAVEARMFDTLAFWLDRGVDGLRLDAVNTLFEDPNLQDNPPLPEPVITLTGVRTQQFVQTRRLPEVHDVLRRVRAFVERRRPDAVLISEAYVDAVDDLVRFYGAGDEMHLPFNFFLAQVPALNGTALRRAVDLVDEACGRDRWPSLVFSNHDIDRACDRYAGREDADGMAKVLATLLLTLRGTPFVYYGEEIAMHTCPPRRLDEVRDPVGRTFWPRYKGRDGVRRPMQWTPDPGHGFTTGQPWLPFAPDASTRTVSAQRADPASPLVFWRALARLRRSTPTLREGGYAAISADHDTFAFRRWANGDEVTVALNVSGEPRTWRAPSSLMNPRWRVLLGTHRAEGEDVDATEVRLRPFETVLMRRC